MKGKNDVIQERLTWKQMQEKYPNQWLGLVDVKYKNDDGATVESAVVKASQFYPRKTNVDENNGGW